MESSSRLDREEPLTYKLLGIFGIFELRGSRGILSSALSKKTKQPHKPFDTIHSVITT